MHLPLRNILFFIIISTFGISAFAQQPAKPPEVSYGHSHLVITAKHHKIPFDVQTATTPAAQEQGLMYRKTLADKHGMLFEFEHQAVVRFWMKNTYIPLDIIFIDVKGNIVRIAENAIPLSLAEISSEVPALNVLEVGGGSAQKYHIHKGDKVIYE